MLLNVLLLLITTIRASENGFNLFQSREQQYDEEAYISRPVRRQERSFTSRQSRSLPHRWPNGKPLSASKPHDTNLDPINDGWQEFQFGEAGTVASPIFKIDSRDLPVRIDVTDLFLCGDRFAVYSLEAGNRAVFIFETDRVDVDNRQGRVTRPDQAFKMRGIFSSGSHLLKPGKYRIMIKPLSSREGGGTAVIRFTQQEASIGNLPSSLVEETQRASLCPGFREFVVVRQPCNSQQSDDVCRLLGLSPARIFGRADMDALQLTHNKCMDRNAFFWINQYERRDELGLAVTITSDTVHLQVKIRDPTESNPVLCRVRSNLI